jgi:AraC-like DNA-binding protein
VFPYRGVYVRHVGRSEAVAEPNQVLFFNEGEPYRITHPVNGGDACLSLGISEPLLRDLAPREQLRVGNELAFRRQHLHIEPRTQLLSAVLRQRLKRRQAERLEAETLALDLVRRALGRPAAGFARAQGRRKAVDRAKLVLSSDVGRRWSLQDVAKDVGVSPVYLTQLFQQVEGVPLYRYHLRLRLARALDLLRESDDLAGLGADLGFSSHSHFSSVFARTYGRTPLEVRRALRAG